jgi:hypothetical protein
MLILKSCVLYITSSSLPAFPAPLSLGHYLSRSGLSIASRPSWGDCGTRNGAAIPLRPRASLARHCVGSFYGRAFDLNTSAFISSLDRVNLQTTDFRVTTSTASEITIHHSTQLVPLHFYLHLVPSPSSPHTSPPWLPKRAHT